MGSGADGWFGFVETVCACVWFGIRVGVGRGILLNTLSAGYYILYRLDSMIFIGRLSVMY